MQLELYNALKLQIETLTSLKYVALWNNQFVRENENVSFGYPCVFIEFTNINYTDQTKGVQSYEMDVNLHLGFESYKTEDTDILTLKQDLNAKVHAFSAVGAPMNTRILRRSEAQNFDHDNIQEYIITYKVSGKDFLVNTLPSTDATVTILKLNNIPIIDNSIIMTGVIADGALLSEIGDILITENGLTLIVE